MHKINDSVKFFVNLAKAQTVLNARFDRGLGGLGFNEFLILLFLDQSDDQQMRRIDLANKIGLTPSGVTRLLLPMEKIGLVKSGDVEEDARVRVVMIAPGGKQKLEEALDRIDVLISDIMPDIKDAELKKISDFLLDMAGRALIN